MANSSITVHQRRRACWHRGGLSVGYAPATGPGCGPLLPAAPGPVAVQAFDRFRKRWPRNWI